MTLHFLHIPRTGGIARWHALEPAMADGTAKVTEFASHMTTMEDIAPEDTPVVFLRDPVSRFVSAYDQLDGQNMAVVRNMPDGTRQVTIDYTVGQSTLVVDAWSDSMLIPFWETWPTCEAAAWDIEEFYRIATIQNIAFMYQTTWLDAERPDTIWARSETMDEDFPRICDAAGIRHQPLPAEDDIERRNRATKSLLSVKAMERVRAFYERDDVLVARHAPRPGIPSPEEAAAVATNRRRHVPSRAVAPPPNIKLTAEIRYRCQVPGGCASRSMLEEEAYWSDGTATLDHGTKPPPPPNEYRPYCKDHVPQES